MGQRNKDSLDYYCSNFKLAIIDICYMLTSSLGYEL